MPYEEEILKELRKISKVITISNGDALEKELSKYASTDERKKIWVLIDGKRNSEQIANEIGITKRTVDLTLQNFESAILIEERKYGIPPKRILDYVPSSWSSLVKILLEKTPQSNESVPKASGEIENG